ncbi:MAG: 30S ribosomal protein S6 [Candidatus Aenigmatarchaeota archaeon]
MENQKVYEIGFWIRISANLEEEINKVLNLIEKFDGIIIEKTIPKKKTLAYPIDKETTGYFNYILFIGKPESIDKIKEELKFYKNILRFIIIKRRINPKEKLANIQTQSDESK